MVDFGIAQRAQPRYLMGGFGIAQRAQPRYLMVGWRGWGASASLAGRFQAFREVQMLLEGKVAIVSGVGPGLGQANARALAREGATVVLAARNADYLAEVQAEIETDGGRALAVPTNLVDADQAGALVDRTIATVGRLDRLVHN